jgi:hypothetical protein
MDIDDLNMMPAFSENLISYKQNPSDSIYDIAGNELPLYDKPEEEHNFEQGYQKIFTPFLPDNKEDILNEIYDVNKVDEFIISFQKVLDDYYFDKNYDGIIERIEKRFPYFFNEKTNGLLYIIQKMKFFELLKEDNIPEAKQFYQDKLLFLIKEIKKDNWEIKNKFFIKLLNNPKLISKQGDLQKKYYDRYTYQLETAIRNFLHENNKEYDDQNSQDDLPLLNSNSNNAFNHLYSSSSIEVNSLKKSYNNISNINVEYNNNKLKDIESKDPIANEENKDDLDLENYSTKEEFSDFEDEIQQKCIDNQEQKEKTDVSSIKLNDNEDIISESEFKLNSFGENSPDFSLPISSCQSKLFKSSFDEENNFINLPEQNEFNIDTSTKNLYKNFDNDEPDNKFNDNKNNANIIHFGEISTNINIIEKENKKKEKKKGNKKNKTKKEETIFSQLPYLNSFKPKYIKRETIDKKIIRLFKNYVIKEYKERRFEIDKKIMDQNFFINLINGNMLPPLEFHEVDTDEYIKFNSFNCSYLLWFFSKKGVKEIYNQFISEKGKEFISDMGQYYEIGTEEEKDQLNTYIMNMPNIFDITLVNNITQGETVMHLYRTVDKNKRIKERQTRKKNDLDLKRLKSNESQRERERSRSRDFDNND